MAQDKPASKKKKPVAAKKDVQKKQEPSKARPQATPEQIRRFNELQKKQQAGK